MQFTEIDRQFEEAFERINRKTLPSGGPYGAAPLAADHFLLKKSWDYFRSRVKAIEDQWHKILQSKDAQLVAVREELNETRSRIVELEEDNRLMRSLDQNVKRARTEDYLLFSKKTETLRHHWDAERDALMKKAETLEFRIGQMKKDQESRLLSARAREERLVQQLEALRKETQLQAVKNQEIQSKFTGEVDEKDDRIQSLDTKVELLRGEIDRRDAVIKELKETVVQLGNDGTAMTSYVEELQRMIKEKDLDLHHQKERFSVLSQEKENLRIGWERERAEWRELWDRGRSLWDKKAS